MLTGLQAVRKFLGSTLKQILAHLLSFQGLGADDRPNYTLPLLTELL